MSSRNVTSPFSTEEHWQHFSDFCHWEIQSGGPDPQLAMVREMTKNFEEQSKVWACLCYIAVYNVPYGEVFWLGMPWGRVHVDSSILYDWPKAAFSEGRVTTRLERRCVRRADWMSEYLVGAKDFVSRWYEIEPCSHSMDSSASYEYLWEQVNNIPRIGRYAALKLVELLTRSFNLPAVPPDIRPRGAWSPRLTLGVLWPDQGLENRDDSASSIRKVNEFCSKTIEELARSWSVKVDMFQLQVLFCEYRESWAGRKQYPGRSLDSELGYARKAEEEWGYTSGIWKARRELFPIKHLGEERGWDGPRKNVAAVLATQGYTWSDLLYDYFETQDFRTPVKWA